MLEKQLKRVHWRLRGVKQKIDVSLFWLPIDFNELSARSTFFCQSNDITTFGDLAQCSRKEMIKIKGLGKTSIDEMEMYLASVGLDLDMFIPNAPKGAKIHFHGP